MCYFCSFAPMEKERAGLVHINIVEFQRLGDRAVIELCVKAYREKTREQNYLPKVQSFMDCSADQKAVITFYLFYNQAIISVTKFQYWSIHMILTGMFSELIQGMKHIGEEEVTVFLENIRRNLLSQDFISLRTEEKLKRVQLLYENFALRSEAWIHSVAAYIRKNHHCFFVFEMQRQTGRG